LLPIAAWQILADTAVAAKAAIKVRPAGIAAIAPPFSMLNNIYQREQEQNTPVPEHRPEATKLK
jgi:hypothetical protein